MTLLKGEKIEKSISLSEIALITKVDRGVIKRMIKGGVVKAYSKQRTHNVRYWVPLSEVEIIKSRKTEFYLHNLW